MNMYTVKEAAKLLGEGESTISRKVRNNVIKAIKNTKGEYRISELDLKRYKGGYSWCESEVGYSRCAVFGSKFDALRGYVDCKSVGKSLNFLYSDVMSDLKDFIKYLVSEKKVGDFLLTGQFGFDLIVLYTIIDLKGEDTSYNSLKITLCLPNKECYDSDTFKNKDFNSFMREVISKKDELGITVIYVDAEVLDCDVINVGKHKDYKIKVATEYIISECDYFAIMVNKYDEDDRYLFTKYTDYAKCSKYTKSIFDFPYSKDKRF